MKHFRSRPQHLPCVPEIKLDLDDPVESKASITVSRDTELHETPRDVADRMVDYAGVQEAMEVLDPSAGLGALLRPAKERGARTIGIEKEWKLVEELRRHPYGHAVIGGDFMAMKPPFRKSDVILMNPPFSKRRAQLHVRHAEAFCRPGGTIVAIVPPNQIPDGFRILEDLPAGTFKSAPGIRTCIIIKTTTTTDQ